MRKLSSKHLTDSSFGTASEFVYHGNGIDLTEEIQKDFKKHGAEERFYCFWEGLLARLGWQMTREELLEVGRGEASLTGSTDDELVKDSIKAFYRVMIHDRKNNDIDLEPGSTVELEKIGQQTHYLIKTSDGKIQGWLPSQAVKSIQLVTGVAGVSEPHDRSSGLIYPD